MLASLDIEWKAVTYRLATAKRCISTVGEIAVLERALCEAAAMLSAISPSQFRPRWYDMNSGEDPRNELA